MQHAQSIVQAVKARKPRSSNMQLLRQQSTWVKTETKNRSLPWQYEFKLGGVFPTIQSKGLLQCRNGSSGRNGMTQSGLRTT
eukprot:190872-Pelagomonas_calceolata.AAC.1